MGGEVGCRIVDRDKERENRATEWKRRARKPLVALDVKCEELLLVDVGEADGNVVLPSSSFSFFILNPCQPKSLLLLPRGTL